MLRDVINTPASMNARLATVGVAVVLVGVTNAIAP